MYHRFFKNIYNLPKKKREISNIFTKNFSSKFEKSQIKKVRLKVIRVNFSKFKRTKNKGFSHPSTSSITISSRGDISTTPLKNNLPMNTGGTVVNEQTGGSKFS